MADIVDTPAPPAEGQVAEPTPEPPLQEALQAELEPVQEQTPEPPAPPPPEEPKRLTEDEIIERAAKMTFDRIASWDGRRQSEFLKNVSGLIDERFSKLTPPHSPGTSTTGR